MKKQTPKEINRDFWIIFACGIVVALYGAFGTGTDYVAFIGMAMMVAAMIFWIVFYRCPHCGRFLDRSTGEFCPHCGEKVNE